MEIVLIIFALFFGWCDADADEASPAALCHDCGLGGDGSGGATSTSSTSSGGGQQGGAIGAGGAGGVGGSGGAGGETAASSTSSTSVSSSAVSSTSANTTSTSTGPVRECYYDSGCSIPDTCAGFTSSCKRCAEAACEDGQCGARAINTGVRGCVADGSCEAGRCVDGICLNGACPMYTPVRCQITNSSGQSWVLVGCDGVERTADCIAIDAISSRCICNQEVNDRAYCPPGAACTVINLSGGRLHGICL